ncbi:hypothetical protein D3C87_1753040 [compost metagenome]
MNTAWFFLMQILGTSHLDLPVGYMTQKRSWLDSVYVTMILRLVAGYRKIQFDFKEVHLIYMYIVEMIQ